MVLLPLCFVLDSLLKCRPAFIFFSFFRYNSPLPTLPSSRPSLSDDEIPADPLPPLPPQYENTRSNSAGGESGIDIGAEDDGYIDDAEIDTPFLPREKPVSIEMDKLEKVPEAKVLTKGSQRKYETQL